jgi:hypothetical protein
MSSSIIDSAQTDATPSVESGAPHHRSPHRAWLVAVALVAVVTLGLTIAWQATAGASPARIPTVTTADSVAVQADPAVSAGAGLLALAWELTPPSQRGAACAQFSADPAAAWAAYSAGADAASIATRAELSAFLGVRC